MAMARAIASHSKLWLSGQVLQERTQKAHPIESTKGADCSGSHTLEGFAREIVIGLARKFHHEIDPRSILVPVKMGINARACPKPFLIGTLGNGRPLRPSRATRDAGAKSN